MTYDQIVAIIAEKMDIPAESITPESNFEDMKVDSLDMVEIVMEIEDKFDIMIEKTEDIKNVRQLSEYIDSLKKT
ncbi:MAG: acyl carrier protein [Christensenellales bacterium]